MIVRGAMQRIILMVGLPGCGKSTWLERRGITPLSSDWVRLVLADKMTDQTIHARVFQTLRYLLRHRIAIGRPETYVDATHLTPEERLPYIPDRASVRMRGGGGLLRRAAGCVPRAESRPQRIVPDEAMQAMAAKLKPPRVEEGFTRVTVVSA